MDKLLGLLGRILYCVPFIGFGIGHLMNAGQMGGMVPTFIPGGVFWVYFTGAAMVAASLAIITGKQARNACFGIALMLLVFVLTMHLPGMANPQMKMMAMMGLFKDTGLMGAALFMAGTFKN